MAQHVFTGTDTPATPPAQVGHHFHDTANRRHYLAYHTGAAADWKDPLSSNSREVTASTVLTKDDHGKTIVVNSAGAVTITVPQTSTEALPKDFKVRVLRMGAGTVTIAKQGADNLFSRSAFVLISAQYGLVDIFKHIAGATNTYFLTGDLA